MEEPSSSVVRKEVPDAPINKDHDNVSNLKSDERVGKIALYILLPILVIVRVGFRGSTSNRKIISMYSSIGTTINEQ